MFDLSKTLVGLVVMTAAIVLFIGAIASGITGTAAYDQGYRQGQIDALSGIIKYEPVEKTEVEWRVKDE